MDGLGDGRFWVWIFVRGTEILKRSHVCCEDEVEVLTSLLMKRVLGFLSLFYIPEVSFDTLRAKGHESQRPPLGSRENPQRQAESRLCGPCAVYI